MVVREDSVAVEGEEHELALRENRLAGVFNGGDALVTNFEKS